MNEAEAGRCFPTARDSAVCMLVDVLQRHLGPFLEKKIIFQEWENTAGVETVAMALSAPFLLQHLQRAQDLGTHHPSLGREGFVLPLAASNKAAKQ